MTSRLIRRLFASARPAVPAAWRPPVALMTPIWRRVSTQCHDVACADPSHEHVAAPAPKAHDCWSCGSCVNFAEWFCQKCDYIQPPSGENNLFRLFGIPETFDLPDGVVEKAYKTLQKFVHPDKFGNRTEKEKEYSSARSTELNKAHEILKNPVSRAQHLLSLHGMDAISETASTAVSPQLLMDIMEKREALEEADSLPHILELKRDCDACTAALVSSLSRAFRAKDLPAAHSFTVHLQYYTRLRHEIDERMQRYQ